MLRPFIQLASRPENSSAKAKAQPQPDPVLQSHASSRASSLSRASFHGDVRTCTICEQDYRDNEELVRLRCRHTFHEECWSTAVIHDAGMECPTCRGIGEVTATFRFVEPTSPQRSRSSSYAGEWGTPEAYPWWPETSSSVLHAETSLPDGSTSVIVDPGAYTNLYSRRELGTPKRRPSMDCHPIGQP